MLWGFEHPVGADGKEPTCRTPKRLWFETLWGPADLEEGMATHSPMDRGAWWAMVHRVTESDMTEAT